VIYLKTFHIFRDAEEEEDIFCYLPSLQQLYLGTNELNSIHFKLDCLKYLTYLDLGYNRFRKLDDRTRETLDELAKTNPDFQVNFRGNAFICDCRLLETQNWMRNTKTNILGKVA